MTITNSPHSRERPTQMGKSRCKPQAPNCPFASPVQGWTGARPFGEEEDEKVTFTKPQSRRFSQLLAARLVLILSIQTALLRPPARRRLRRPSHDAVSASLSPPLVSLFRFQPRSCILYFSGRPLFAQLHVQSIRVASLRLHLTLARRRNSDGLISRHHHSAARRPPVFRHGEPSKHATSINAIGFPLHSTTEADTEKNAVP